MLQADNSAALPFVNFNPPDIARRHVAAWSGIRADAVQAVRKEPLEYGFQGEQHLLIASERAERYEGETSVEGLPTSSARNFSRKLTFVPAGRRFHGWQQPRALTQVTYFYLDPAAPLLDPELHFRSAELMPRIFFFDQNLWDTAMKLRGQAEQAVPERAYAEALSMVLLHELLHADRGQSAPETTAYGELAAWQRKRVADYIDEHLADNISVSDLASIAQLSPYHFSRAFRQSFGMPPHQYHLARRIELSKSMLGEMSLTVTEIGSRLGFSETSAFTSTFRKMTGRTPTDFRRSLI